MRQTLLLGIIAVLATGASTSARAQFCPGGSLWVFDDVLASDPFCADVTWVAQHGISLGCQVIDAQHRLYCPNANVTRIQMAAFMSRLGATTFTNGGNTFGSPALLGTLDNQPLELRIQGNRVARYEPNATSPNVVAGHMENSIDPLYGGQTVGGGGAAGQCGVDAIFGNPLNCRNSASGDYATVAGGKGNSAGAQAGFVGGGWYNISGARAVVVGGAANFAAGNESFVGGGSGNHALVVSSAIVGGMGNHTSGAWTFVGGGIGNTASGQLAFVGGGQGNVASGLAATAPGGVGNIASGSYSVALGAGARTQSGPGGLPHDGSFAFADDSPWAFYTTQPREFAVRATGGARMVLAIDGSGTPTWTCSVVAGGSWACSSDRSLKQNLAKLDGRDVLAKVVAMPVYRWNPKQVNEHHVHYGPTAQDFFEAFGLGGSSVAIGQQDADGVALAAIQGLNAKLEATIADQAREIADLRRALEMLMTRLPEDRGERRGL